MVMTALRLSDRTEVENYRPSSLNLDGCSGQDMYTHRLTGYRALAPTIISFDFTTVITLTYHRLSDVNILSITCNSVS